MYATLDAGRITATVRDISREAVGGVPRVWPEPGQCVALRSGRGLGRACPPTCSPGLAYSDPCRVGGRRPHRRGRLRVDAPSPNRPRVVDVDLAQGLEAGVSDVIFLGVALFFLFSLEAQSKRRQALASLNDLRSIAHVIDMHQLTKDPEIARRAGEAKTMSQIEIARYLDYCSELLAVTSKLAALHLQAFSDPVVLDSVNGIQALTLGLSGKIWQKIMILDMVASAARR